MDKSGQAGQASLIDWEQKKIWNRGNEKGERDSVKAVGCDLAALQTWIAHLWIFQSDKDSRGKARSWKSLQFILSGTWIRVTNSMAIHPTAVEMDCSESQIITYQQLVGLIIRKPQMSVPNLSSRIIPQNKSNLGWLKAAQLILWGPWMSVQHCRP